MQNSIKFDHKMSNKLKTDKLERCFDVDFSSRNEVQQRKYCWTQSQFVTPRMGYIAQQADSKKINNPFYLDLCDISIDNRGFQQLARTPMQHTVKCGFFFFVVRLRVEILTNRSIRRRLRFDIIQAQFKPHLYFSNI